MHKEFCKHHLKFLRPDSEIPDSSQGERLVTSRAVLFVGVVLSLLYTQKSHHLFPFCCFLFQILSCFTASVNHHFHCLSPISAYFRLFHSPHLLGKTWLHTERVRDQRPGVHKLIFSPSCIWHIHLHIIPTKADEYL